MTRLILYLTMTAGLIMVLASFAGADSWQGRVLDAASGEPVVGAYVEVSTGESKWGGLTDQAGSYTIEAGAGPASVRVQALGYEQASQSLASSALSPLFELALDLKSGEVFVIEASTPSLRAATSHALTGETLRSLPGSGNDVLKSVQSLPGVARVPFGGGGLVLRGTSPRDSSVYLDGIEVPMLYHFGNLASFYPSALLSSMEIIPSGFGAAYGRAQGGMVTLDSKAGRRDQWRSAGEISLLDASVRADGPGGKNSSWSLAIRRSYIDAVLAAAIPSDSSVALTVAPRYFDAQLRFDYVASDKDVLTAMIFGADDRVQLGINQEPSFDEGPDGFRFDTRFWRLGLKWQRVLGDTTISVTPWVGLDSSELRVGARGATRQEQPAGLRADVSHDYEGGATSSGLDVQGRRSALSLTNEPPPMPGVVEPAEVTKETVDTYADIALYHEHSLFLGRNKWLTLKPGLRVERFGLSREWTVDPRLGLRQRIGRKVALKQAIGLYHQPPALSDKDWSESKLRSSYATQADVGAEWKPRREATLSATVFGSQAERLPVDVVSSASAISSGGSLQSGGAGSISSQLVEEQFGSWTYREPVGKGRSIGTELMARWQGERFFGWLAYTWSRSKRTGDPRADATYYRYLLDQPHVFTALGSYDIGAKWKVGGRVRYASGNPYTPVAGSYFNSDEQSYKPIDGGVLSDRLPSFFQIDLRVDRSWNVSFGRIAAFLDVQNVTNAVNPEGVSYSYDYSSRNYTRGLPIFPSIGLEFVQ